jgi:hypothetical protein
MGGRTAEDLGKFFESFLYPNRFRVDRRDRAHGGLAPTGSPRVFLDFWGFMFEAWRLDKSPNVNR